jgi:putative transposase
MGATPVIGMRKRRELLQGACYHVTARINRKEMLLVPKPIKDLFLAVLGEAKSKYRFRIDNFCIMENHFHLMIQPLKNECLSSIMQWILSVFAMRYNRIMGLTGHVWGNRFFSRIIRSLLAYESVFRYIDENPQMSGLVSALEIWRYSGKWLFRVGEYRYIDPLLPWGELLFPAHTVLRLG